jgi:hypothetical protein
VTDNSNPSLPLELDNTQRVPLPHYDFNSKAQFWEIFRRGLKQFIRTLIIAVILVLVIWQFSRQKVMSHKMKVVFNAINIGLSMALGICVTEGFKCMAIDIRWWILSRKKRSLPEVSSRLQIQDMIDLTDQGITRSITFFVRIDLQYSGNLLGGNFGLVTFAVTGV